MGTALGDQTMAGMATQNESANQAMLEKEGKYLTFALAHESTAWRSQGPRDHRLHRRDRDSPDAASTSEESSISAVRSFRWWTAGQVRHGSRGGHGRNLHYRRGNLPTTTQFSTGIVVDRGPGSPGHCRLRISRKPRSSVARPWTPSHPGMAKVGESVKICSTSTRFWWEPIRRREVALPDLSKMPD